MTKFDQNDTRRASWAIFILLITILSLFNLLVILFAGLDDVKRVAIIVNIILSLLFLTDFLIHIYLMEDKKGYFWGQLGWLDLLGSIPIPGFNLARIWRFITFSRNLRHAGSKEIIRQVAARRADTALIFVALAVIYIIEFGSIFILRAETGAQSANILTAGDALWWVLVTISTVGYGDKFPVTGSGRFVGMFVIFAGVGVFGTLSGFLAKTFLGERKNKTDNQKEESVDPLLLEIRALQEAYLDGREKQEEETAKLQSRLENLEKLLQEIHSRN
jgi:voltage-gated potassium channel